MRTCVTQKKFAKFAILHLSLISYFKINLSCSYVAKLNGHAWVIYLPDRSIDNVYSISTSLSPSLSKYIPSPFPFVPNYFSQLHLKN